MSVDKLVDSSQLDSDLTSVANAIRTKGGTSAQLAFPSDFVSAINAISGGGGYTADDWLDKTKPIGAVSSQINCGDVSIGANNNAYSGLLKLRSGITSLSMPNTIGIPQDFCNSCSGLVSVDAKKVTLVRESAFYGCTSLLYAVFPLATFAYSSSFYNCKEMLGADFGGNITGAYTFRDCVKLATLVIRSNSVVSLGALNQLAQNTPFKNGGTGGHIYIPQSLYNHLGDGTSSDYKAATNWATIDGYGTITWHAIEGSTYETHYVDGTLIPTT